MIEVRFDVVRDDIAILSEPAQRFAQGFLVDVAIKLGAIAGRQDQGLGNARAGVQGAERGGQLRKVEGDLFANLYRRGLVAESEYEQCHGARAGKTSRSASEPESGCLCVGTTALRSYQN